jgi:Cu2+-containing amine oxidase
LVGKLLVLLLPVLPLGCGGLQGGAKPSRAAPADKTASAKKAARELVEKSRGFKDLLNERERGFLVEKSRDVNAKDKIYFTSAELVSPKDDGERPREVTRNAGVIIVNHYRYKTDEVIRSTVDLGTRRVLKVEHFAHLPTPLSAEELQTAKELAFADGRVKKALKPYDLENVVVEPLLPRVNSKKDPAFGHRVVNLLFLVGSDYLGEPRVLVDLTTRKVEVDNPTAAKKNHEDSEK